MWQWEPTEAWRRTEDGPTLTHRRGRATNSASPTPTPHERRGGRGRQRKVRYYPHCKTSTASSLAQPLQGEILDDIRTANMAPSFEQLDPETEYENGEEDIDFSGMILQLGQSMAWMAY